MTADVPPQSDRPEAEPKSGGTASRVVGCCLVSAVLLVAFADFIFSNMGDSSPVSTSPGPPEPLVIRNWVEVGPWEGVIVACEPKEEGLSFVRCAPFEPGVDHTYGMSVGEVEDFRRYTTDEQRTATQDCVPSHLATCYRVIAGGLGVERTVDDGATWEVEWEVSQADAVERLGLTPGPDDPPLTSLALAIVEYDDGYAVGVASGWAGLAIRDASGTWNLGVLEERP